MLEIKETIRSAFAGVHLEGGVSLRQAEVMDNRGRGVTGQEFRALPRQDITDDWTALTLETLDRYPYIGFFDAKAFRYYIPAFLLSVMDCYEPGSLRVISTLSALYPKRGDAWEHQMLQYSLLDAKQRCAIATFLRCLPEMLELEPEDQKIVARAFRNYWHQEL